MGAESDLDMDIISEFFISYTDRPVAPTVEANGSTSVVSDEQQTSEAKIVEPAPAEPSSSVQKRRPRATKSTDTVKTTIPTTSSRSLINQVQQQCPAAYDTISYSAPRTVRKSESERMNFMKAILEKQRAAEQIQEAELCINQMITSMFYEDYERSARFAKNDYHRSFIKNAVPVQPSAFYPMQPPIFHGNGHTTDGSTIIGPPAPLKFLGHNAPRGTKRVAQYVDHSSSTMASGVNETPRTMSNSTIADPPVLPCSLPSQPTATTANGFALRPTTPIARSSTYRPIMPYNHRPTRKTINRPNEVSNATNVNFANNGRVTELMANCKTSMARNNGYDASGHTEIRSVVVSNQNRPPMDVQMEPSMFEQTSLNRF